MRVHAGNWNTWFTRCRIEHEPCDRSGAKVPELTSYDRPGRMALVVALGCGLIWPAGASAQPTRAPVPPSVAAIEASPKQTMPTSMGHVVAKTLTLNTGIAVSAMTIYSLGTASLVAGSALTAGSLLVGFTVYPANEYLWDRFSPSTNVRSNNEAFDTSASLWRTTYKYLTLKVATTVSKFSILYIYTGSVASTMVMGTAASVVFPLIVYANDIGWDWYDWYNTSAEKHG
jgi:uncharacterized membrane protein